jgi:predicted porin
MKKLLIASAALAMVAGTAQAQSSVTISGRIDQSVGSYKTDAANSGASKVTSNIYATSRITFAGTEDLGGGLKAGFFLETGITPDDGKASNATLFDRESNIFVSDAKLGELRVGKITTHYTDSDVFVNATTSHVAGMNQALVGSAVTGSSTVSSGVYTKAKVESAAGDSANNTIQYTSPSFAGATVQVFRSESTDSEATGATLGTVEGFAVRYTNGKFKATVGQASTRTAGADKVEKGTSMGASYDFGVVRVGAIRAVRDNTDQRANDKGTADVFSVAYPVNTKVTLVGAYHNYKNDESSTYDGKATVVGATYDFSKRTAAYVTYAKTKNESAGNYSITGMTGTAAGADEKLTSVGIKHFF